MLNQWSSYTDEALGAASSPGLVRLGAKDVPLVAPAQGGFTVGPYLVDLREPLARSSCACAAHGTCRHIIAAVLYCREQAPAEVQEASTVMAMSDDDLRKWAGKSLLERAQRYLARAGEVEVKEAATLLVRFARRDLDVHFPHGDVASAVCSCRSPHICEHRVAAVLALQTARGMRSAAVAERGALRAARHAVRSRSEVFGAVAQVLTQMLTCGLSRLSAVIVERLRTLSVSAHGVDLPRLESLLTSLALEADLHLARNARASTASLLERASQVRALLLALEHPTAGLVGFHRGEFTEVGVLDLVGVGARAWRSASYLGLTLYFWDEAHARFLSWSEVRPQRSDLPFDPLRRYREMGPWGAVTPEVWSRATLRLRGAWWSDEGRLSQRDSVHGDLLGPADVHRTSAALSDWGLLRERASRLFGGSLRERSDNEYVVLLAPTQWLPARFDDTAQVLRGALLDAAARPLQMVLPYSSALADAICLLEAPQPPSTMLLGRLRLFEGTLAVEPYTLHQPLRALHLSVDEIAAPVARKKGLLSKARHLLGMEGDNEPQPEMGDLSSSASPLGRLLGALQVDLENLAEAGTASHLDFRPLQEIQPQLQLLGLRICAQAVAAVLENRSAETLLRAYYVARLSGRLDALRE